MCFQPRTIYIVPRGLKVKNGATPTLAMFIFFMVDSRVIGIFKQQRHYVKGFRRQLNSLDHLHQ